MPIQGRPCCACCRLTSGTGEVGGHGLTLPRGTAPQPANKRARSLPLLKQHWMAGLWQGPCPVCSVVFSRRRPPGTIRSPCTVGGTLGSSLLQPGDARLLVSLCCTPYAPTGPVRIKHWALGIICRGAVLSVLRLRRRSIYTYALYRAVDFAGLCRRRCGSNV